MVHAQDTFCTAKLNHLIVYVVVHCGEIPTSYRMSVVEMYPYVLYVGKERKVWYHQHFLMLIQMSTIIIQSVYVVSWYRYWYSG